MPLTSAQRTQFFARMENVARGLNETILREGQELVDLWFSQAMSGDPELANDPQGTAAADYTAMITMLQNLQGFMKNGAVTQGDRQPALGKFLIRNR
jgi:hypothetical protein